MKRVMLLGGLALALSSGAAPAQDYELRNELARQRMQIDELRSQVEQDRTRYEQERNAAARQRLNDQLNTELEIGAQMDISESRRRIERYGR